MAAVASSANGTRKHGACDQCRARKVKCSGDQDDCIRCRVEGIFCHFSNQKTMGRPRKRPKEDGNGELEDRDATSRESNNSSNSVPRRTQSSKRQRHSMTTHLESTTSRSAVTSPSPKQTLDMSPGLTYSDDIYGVQIPFEAGYGEVGTPEADLLCNGQPGRIANSEPQSGNGASVQAIDMLSVSCSCLNQLYSMLMSFQSLPSPSFPSSRGPLMKATKLARSIVQCPFCPRNYPSALQNLMLLNTLLLLVTHGYAELLVRVDEQAKERTNVTYRVGDNSPSNAHLHTYTPDCPMGFNVSLDPDEWAAMARKVVKQDVYGNAQTTECLLGVVEELEQRQHIWHLLQPFSHSASCSGHSGDKSASHDGFCLQLTGRIRAAIDSLKL